jgi:aryl-alcohol dehydrogenase-like predicted oxidoreductase
MMEHRTLGRTGFHVSVLGLGCGGRSRLGQAAGRDAEHSASLVRLAIEQGINFIDTAEAYRTEPFVGMGIREVRRDALVISTKKSPTRDGAVIAPADLEAALQQSLRHLGSDYVDVYHLHGVRADHYAQARDALMPRLQRLKRQGRIRAIGITEHFGGDPGHAMLQQAVQDDCWDVMMVGFNILNQSARDRVLAEACRKGIGILDMFAVRNDLHQPDKLRQTIAQLVAAGQIDPDVLDAEDPLGFLVRDGAAVSLPDAAYRFCRAEPGIHVVLFGTGSREHLLQNVASIHRPPLPEADQRRLMDIFARVDSVSAQ